MQTYMLGVIVVADKLCVKIDFDEYMKYKRRHHDCKTSRVIKEFRLVRNINSSVVIIVKQLERKKVIKSINADIASIAVSVIDTSLALTNCDWWVACTVKGKFQTDEQKIISDIYPCISYTLINSFVESINKPLIPQF